MGAVGCDRSRKTVLRVPRASSWYCSAREANVVGAITNSRSLNAERRWFSAAVACCSHQPLGEPAQLGDDLVAAGAGGAGAALVVEGTRDRCRRCHSRA